MQIKQIAVVGCGTMGAGIIQVAAQTGIEVVGVERTEPDAEAARLRVEAGLEATAARGRITPEQAREAASRFTVTTDLARVADADLVVEAVFEDVELKKGVLKEIDGLVGPDTFIASNTSTIPLVILAAATSRPDRVVGLHFFNPVPAMKLVEVIKTPVTSADHVRTMVDLAVAMGKNPVVVNDVPGFVGNLLIVPYLLDAVRAFERGVADMESIDSVIRLGFNHPMGPFRLSDLIGLDIVHDMAASMYEEYKDPRYFPPPLLKQYVRLGWLGRKTGRGSTAMTTEATAGRSRTADPPALVEQWDTHLRSVDPLRFAGYAVPASEDESVRTGVVSSAAPRPSGSSATRAARPGRWARSRVSGSCARSTAPPSADCRSSRRSPAVVRASRRACSPCSRWHGRRPRRPGTRPPVS